MVKIVSNASSITIYNGRDEVTIAKSKIGGVRKTYPKIIIFGDNSFRLYDIDFISGELIIDGVTYTDFDTASDIIDGLSAVGVRQQFIAVIGQTAFPCTFTCDATTCRIYVQGVRDSLAGWTFPLGVPTYAAGMIGGEVVIIERIN